MPPKPDRKTARVTIRLTPRMLAAIREKADNLGLPYQILIRNVLHRLALGEIDPWPIPRKKS